MGKLTDEQRREIARRVSAGENRTRLAEEFDVSRQTIHRNAKDYTEELKAGGSIYTEYGVSGLSRFGGSVMEDYDQQWKTLGRMVPLIKEMLDHPVIGAMIFAIEMSLRGAEWTVTPAGETPTDIEAAEFLESCMEDLSHSWDDHITQAVSMISFGFAPFEIVYKKRLGLDRDPISKYVDGRIGWRKFAFRAQDSLASGREWDFDENGGIRAMNQQAPPTWRPVSIPIEKMVLYRTTAAKNNPQGRSALRAASKPWYFSKNLSEIEGISAERMGTGFPVMYLGDGTRKEGSNSDYELAKMAVRDIRADEQGGLVIPHPKQTSDGRGALFELMSPPSRGVVDFNQSIDRYNKQIAQTLLAQFIFLGMANVGTQALAVRSTDFFSKAISGWLKTIAETLNRHAVPRLFKLNAWTGLSGLPEFTVGDIGEIDLTAFMEAVNLAVGAGVLEPDEGTERIIRQRLDLPEKESAEAGEELGEEEQEPEETQEPPIDEGDKDAVSELERLSQMAEEALGLLHGH